MNILYFNKMLTDDEIKDCMNYAYKDISGDILVCHDYFMADLFDEKDNLIMPEEQFYKTHIVERIDLGGGDFPLLVNMYPRGELNNDEVYTNLIVARKIAKYKNVDIVISDKSLHPYLYWLIDPNGNVYEIIIKDALMDENNQVSIDTRYDPLKINPDVK